MAEQVTTRGDARLSGASGIGFCVLAALENPDFPAVPGSAGETAAVYAGGTAFASMVAGIAALGLFALFAVSLPLPAGRQSRIARGAALVAVALAGVAALIGVRLVAGSPALDWTTVTELHELRIVLRAAAGAATASALLIAAPALRAARVIPRWLDLAALPVAIALVVAGHPIEPDERAVMVTWAGAALWIGLVSAVLLLEPFVRLGARTVVVAALSGAVAVAAGVSGAALVVFPDATADFFAWPVGPPQVASLLGGAYLVAALGYGLALRSLASGRDDDTRAALVGIVALCLPVCTATAIHIDRFDLSRWQSLAWVVLFAVFPLAATLAWPTSAGPTARSGRWPLTAYAGLAVTAAAALWSGAVPGLLPGPAGALSARVLAGWLVLVAALALWRAWWAGGRAAAVMTTGIPLAWLVAAVIHSRLADALPWAVLMAVLAVLSACASRSTRRDGARRGAARSDQAVRATAHGRGA